MEGSQSQRSAQSRSALCSYWRPDGQMLPEAVRCSLPGPDPNLAQLESSVALTSPDHPVDVAPGWMLNIESLQGVVDLEASGKLQGKEEAWALATCPGAASSSGALGSSGALPEGDALGAIPE
eukprot:15452711-Alexandrium_andersonii.AAC.1